MTERTVEIPDPDGHIARWLGMRPAGDARLYVTIEGTDVEIDRAVEEYRRRAAGEPAR